MFVYHVFVASPIWLAVGPWSLWGGLFADFLMCVLLVKQLLRLVGRLSDRKPVWPHQRGDCCYSN